MPLFEVTESGLKLRPPEQFRDLHMYERADLQRLLREDISVLDPDLLVISEEFGNWEDARRRIDLLAIDRNARLVVIELKRTEHGGHMELQAIRYAAMVSTMSYSDVLAAFEAHREKHHTAKPDLDPEDELRAWIGQPGDVEEAEVSTDVAIVLVSADFGREITTSVLWLNQFEGMDIRCVRLRPYDIDNKIVIDLQQVLPLPEAAEYQVRVRRKEAVAERVRTGSRDFTRFVILRGDLSTTSLNKRRAILEMVTALHETGISMRPIMDVMPDSKMRAVAGELEDAEDVEDALRGADLNFSRGRWFVGDAFVDDGHTFVLSNQWGTRTESVLARLRDTFPSAGVSFRRADDA